ncbi:MAG TPA: PilZ domain-containing protein [Nannocystaceae bacterium]|nr:PilZ domain-containing protein [Nannocystaceae bacterium]
MQIANERRGQPRATLDTTVIAFIGDERIECRAVDISANGIALLSPVVRSNGQFLRVNFALPQAGGPRWLDADGVVARVARAEQGILLGVQFLVIEDRAAREVHAYVEHTRLAAAHARQQETYVRRVAGSGTPASMPAARSGSTGEQRIPDANNPPRVTGEYAPPQRRTQEYATSDDESTSRPAPAAIATAPTMEAPRAPSEASGTGRWPSEMAEQASASGRWPGEASGASHASDSGRFPGDQPVRTPTGSTARADSSGGAGRPRDTGTRPDMSAPPRRTTRPPEAASGRRPTPTTPQPAEAPRMSKNDLAALYRDALDEVEGKKPAKKKK